MPQENLDKMKSLEQSSKPRDSQQHCEYWQVCYITCSLATSSYLQQNSTVMENLCFQGTLIWHVWILFERVSLFYKTLSKSFITKHVWKNSLNSLKITLHDTFNVFLQRQDWPFEVCNALAHAWMKKGVQLIACLTRLSL